MKAAIRLGLAAALICACVAARAENITTGGGVYFGDPEGAKPATIRYSDCFEVIPEWKEIQRRKLDQRDADYWILLKAANARFQKAVEAVATAGGYDLVAEEGCVQVPEGQKAPPDVTASVIAGIKDDLDAGEK